MPVLDRIRGRRDLAADATRTLADAGDTVAALASEARDVIADQTSEASAAVTATVGDVADRVGAVATRAGDRLETVFRDAGAAVRDGADLDELTRRLERRWPGTDTDRYDRAYERGFARGRSGRLAVGLVLGASVAGAAAYLLDPERGRARREALQARLSEIARQARAAIEEQRRALEAGRSQRDSSVRVGTDDGPLATDRWSGSADADARIPVATGTAGGHDTERGDWHRELPA